MDTVLTRTEFDGAVKDALRHYTRADMLVGNKLLYIQALKQHGPVAAGTQGLRTMLAETAETLFANTRDEKIYRVLNLTYFNPAPKQEAAADRLGLSFSTYRRYLGTGVGRISEYLWHQEQDGVQQPTPVVLDRAGGGGTGQSGARRPLSLVVLPFLSLSRDAELGYLADGIVDNLLTDISRALPGSYIVSRSTAFTYKDRNVPIRQIGEELRVRYVLEGSVLADETHIRVNAQLVDARTDDHVWAERFDKERKDILRVQEEIVARLSRAVGIEMLRNDAGRGGTDGGDAVDLVMRGRALAIDIRKQANAVQAVSLFRRALEMDPRNVDAMVGIASTGIFQLLNRYRTDARDRLLDEAEELISRAFSISPDHIGVQKARAALLRARGRFDEAIVATRAVIEQNPGEPTAYRELGLNSLYLGATAEAASWFRRADDVAPRDPARWTWLQGLARALIQLGQNEEATAVVRMAMDSNPDWDHGNSLLAACQALTGKIQCAKRHMATYLEANPGITIGRYIEERSSVPLDAVSPIYRREVEAILEGLRLAGMPDR